MFLTAAASLLGLAAWSAGGWALFLGALGGMVVGFLAHRLLADGAGRGSPARASRGLGVAPPSCGAADWSRMRGSALAEIAGVLREGARALSDSARRVGVEADEAAVDLIRARLCLACERRGDCWGGGTPSASEVLRARLGPGTRGLRASVELGCVRGDVLDLALALVRPLAELARRHLLERQETCLALATHLWELARSLESLAGAECWQPGSADGGDRRPRRLGYRLEVAKLAAPGRVVSGDAHLVMDLPDGRVVAAISDGMGRGLRAARQSRATTAWLARLIRAGVRIPLAFGLLNTLLALRAGGEEAATLDVAEVDLATGRAFVLKAGAPPTYLLRAGFARPLGAPSAPLGILAACSPCEVGFTVRAGDVLVMMSDGVVEADPAEGWTQAWLEGWLRTRGSGAELARSLVAAARRRQGNGRGDDQSVLVLTFAGKPVL